MLTKKRNIAASGSGLSQMLAGSAAATVDRRTFLRRSGLAAGGMAAASALPLGMVRKADAAAPAAGAGDIKLIKNVCTHCSVGCTVTAEVQNGVWIGQEPSFDSPFNLGAHCAKGAAIREHAHGERRLKYPMKLVNGRYQRISWDEAINEIGDRLLKIRETSGPDSVYWLGSAKFSNEQVYLVRKLAAFWGTNNVDHQARICHSTTVAGVGQTFGYGAMTNSLNDIHNTRCMFLIGSNPAEAHPVGVMHLLKAKENGAKMIVCDPRFTRTAAHADEHVRFRPGTDVALMWGILHVILENGWEDKEYIKQRVFGFDEVRKEVAKWTPEETERVTGVPAGQIKRVARTLKDNRPFTVIWCMGATQHHHANNGIRCYTALGLAMGTVGVSGGGMNILRGHDNVQGATDLGLDIVTLPAYYGLTPVAWKHWAGVWGVSVDYLKSRFKDEKMMGASGIPCSRWFDGVLEAKENIDQADKLKAMVYWGHAPNSQTRGADLKAGMEKLDTLVIIDPYPTASAVIPDRKDGVYLLPAATQLETDGSRTATNRGIQWGYAIMKPLFEAKTDHEIAYLFAKKFGFAGEMFKNIKVNGTVPEIESITREFNKGALSIGYSGQSPERLKRQLANQKDFNRTTLLAESGPCKGEYYGLPWPCWGTPEHNHPGTPYLYNTSLPVARGGLNFRAAFGPEYKGMNLLAEGSAPVGNELKDGHPQFTYGLLQKLGWDKDLTEAELAEIKRIGGDKPEAVSWSTDTSGGVIRVAIKHGCAPFGNGKARAWVWNFPDPVPLHREPLYAPDRQLVAKYPTYADKKQYRLPTMYKSIQDKDFSKDFPIILTSGRLVEYEGGGEETRSNPWLAELQQNMFIEVNPADASRIGVQDMQDVWVYGPDHKPDRPVRIKVKALVTERVGKGVAWMPFHFAGHWMGKDLRSKYPDGADPIVLGESSNTIQTYGYDSVTAMQETKTTLCRIEKA